LSTCHVRTYVQANGQIVTYIYAVARGGRCARPAGSVDAPHGPGLLVLVHHARAGRTCTVGVVDTTHHLDMAMSRQKKNPKFNDRHGKA
jgi:hypothetical protein